MDKQPLIESLTMELAVSIDFILSVTPSETHMQLQSELGEEIQKFITGDYELIKKSADYAVKNYISQFHEAISENQSFTFTKSHFLIPFLIFVKLIAFLKTHEIDEQFILMMHTDTGIAKALMSTVAMKVAAKADLSEKMSGIAKTKHSAGKRRFEANKKIIREVWKLNNWGTYTACAEHIFQNNLADGETYRNIYALVSKVAKERI